MHRHSILARLACVLTVALQLALPVVTVWADGRLERESRSPRAASHVEAHHSAQCPRTHPPDCGLCKHVATPLARLAPPRFELLPTRGHRVAVAASERPARWDSFALPQPRAPPLS